MGLIVRHCDVSQIVTSKILIWELKDGFGLPFKRAVQNSTATILCILFATLLNACAGILVPGVTRTYEPFVVSTHTSRAELFAAAQRVAAEVPDAQLRVVPERYSVTIVVPQSDAVREWTRITASEDGAVRVVVRTELLEDGRYWHHTPCVCENYSYARERVFAAAVLHAAGRPQEALGEARAADVRSLVN